MKNNIKKLWWRDMVQSREDVVGLDSSIISSPLIWKASGHIAGFSDPMVCQNFQYRNNICTDDVYIQVDCKVSKLRYRADQVFWGRLESTVSDSPGVYVTILESANMLAEATAIAQKKAQKLGISGPFKPLELRDLTEAPESVFPLIPSPATGEPGHLTPPRDFNLMFQTSVGALSDDSSVAYLRPETAQGIFTNFVNVQRSSRMKVHHTLALDRYIV